MLLVFSFSLLSSGLPFSFFTNYSSFKHLKIDLCLFINIQEVKSGTGVDTGYMKIRRGSPPCPSLFTLPKGNPFLTSLLSHYSNLRTKVHTSLLPPFLTNLLPKSMESLVPLLPTRSLSRACSSLAQVLGCPIVFT